MHWCMYIISYFDCSNSIHQCWFITLKSKSEHKSKRCLNCFSFGGSIGTHRHAREAVKWLYLPSHLGYPPPPHTHTHSHTRPIESKSATSPFRHPLDSCFCVTWHRIGFSVNFIRQIYTDNTLIRVDCAMSSNPAATLKWQSAVQCLCGVGVKPAKIFWILS